MNFLGDVMRAQYAQKSIILIFFKITLFYGNFQANRQKNRDFDINITIFGGIH